MEAPIPYIGSKRLWAKELAAIAEKLPPKARVLDAYGGSGLCAHVIKSTRPDLTVVTCDADGYIKRWLPHAAAFRRWFDRNAARPIWGKRERASLIAAIKDKETADRIFDDITRVHATHLETDRHKADQGNHRLTLGEAPEDYLKGVKVIKMMWGPGNPIPAENYDFIILDPPYNPSKSLDDQRYGTRRDDPPLSLWAAQDCFKSDTPAICWGRDGWIVDYDHATKVASKRASRGHAEEWLAANRPAVKLGIKPSLFE